VPVTRTQAGARTQSSGKVVVAGRPIVADRNTVAPTSVPGVPDPPVPPPLPNAPVISNIVESTPTQTAVTISWHVDQPSQGRIYYDTNTGTVKGDYALSTALEASYDYMDHTQNITGLTPGTLYYYRVWGQNAAAQESLSAEGTFTTEAEPDPGPGPGEPVYPVDMTLAYVDPTTKAVPSVGVWTLDTTTPGGNTEYLRVTGISPARKQYSTHQFWNSDETYVYVEGSAASGSGQHSLIRTSDWVKEAELSNVPSHQIWSHTNPNIMYGTDGVNKLISYNVLTQTRTTIVTFSGYSAIDMGGGDGAFSWDDNIFMFRATAGSQKRLIRYNRTTGSIATRNITNTPNNHKVGASGVYGILNWENNDGTGSEQGVWLINMTTLANIRQLQNNGDHGDCGKDASGNDIYVTGYVGGSGRSVGHYSYRMDQSGTSLDKGPLLPPSAAQLFQAGHVSMQCPDRPGYAYLSAYGSWTLSSPYNYRTAPGYGQVLAVPVDGSAVDGTPVQSFGFHRSSHTQDGGDAAYDREPQACPTHDGSIVAVTTKWSTSTSLLTGSTYVFLLRAEQ
jgi:hypothetical protein